MWISIFIRIGRVGRIKTIDRDKATIVSFDGEASVDFRRIRNFKEKTREKPLFRIDVSASQVQSNNPQNRILPDPVNCQRGGMDDLGIGCADHRQISPALRTNIP
jgi:hypothetical protein